MTSALEAVVRLGAGLLTAFSLSCAADPTTGARDGGPVDDASAPPNMADGAAEGSGCAAASDASSPDASACPGVATDFPVSEICVGGLTFQVRVAGPASGEAVLLLHGFPEGSYEWRFQMRALTAAGYRVIAPDQRGYSPEARPPATSDYALANLLTDALGLVDALGVNRFHVVGHDWGAAVAWGLALVAPQRVITLTSVSIPAPGALSRVLADMSSCQYQASSYFDTFVAPNSEDAFLQNDGAMLRLVYAGLSSDAQCVYVSALNHKEALHAAFNWYRANVANRQVVGAVDTHVTAPTMLIWGDQDAFICNAGVDITSQFVDGPYRLAVLQGVNHWVPELAPDQMNALLLEQLGSIRDR
jgi:pimeloyl-ACP methyl ester carboxylesterase